MSSGDPAIDVHTHFVPHGWPELPGAEPAWLRVESEREAMIMVGSREFRRIQSDCWDPAVRLADMDADGVAQQIVSPTPVFFGYADTAADATKIAAIFNDLALKICAGAPDRLVPFCQVPLQDTDAACAELDRCLANGHAGVEIGNHVGDRDLDDAGIVTFLQHCAGSGRRCSSTRGTCPLAAAATVDGAVAHRHARPRRTCRSWRMVLGGVFDRIDRSLRICFAHGGGSFPMWVGRMDNAWHRRPDVIATSEHPPSHYVDRFSVDSVVFDEAPCGCSSRPWVPAR